MRIRAPIAICASLTAGFALAVSVHAQRNPNPTSRANAQNIRAGDLNVGDVAPDFTLPPRGGGAAVQVSSFRGKSPVALVFGSYT